MKKLLFLAKYPLHMDYSLKAKFNSQIKAFEELGFDVHYIAFDDRYYYDISKDGREKIFKYSLADNSYYIHTKAFCDMYRAASRILDNTYSYIYVRDDALEYFGLELFKKAKRLHIDIMCEVPTYPPYSIEDESPKRKALLMLSEFFKKRARKCISLYALIGEKCKGHYMNRPAINIDNGLNPKALNIRENKTDKENIQLVAIASMSTWQGYDRLIKGIAECEQKYRLKLYLVGDEGDGSLSSWKNLVQELNIEDIVEFKDPMYGHELDSLINTSDLAICGLALFRKGMKIASTLKLGEYMARGIPFVYATEDSRLDKGFKYALRLSEDDSPLPMNLIIAFAEQFKNDTEHMQIMRDYAIKNMSWEAQFRKLFEFFDEDYK